MLREVGLDLKREPGAHDLDLAHDERADHGASTRLQLRLVSGIALLGDTPHHRQYTLEGA
jgi:hypothetical protein